MNVSFVMFGVYVCCYLAV